MAIRRTSRCRVRWVRVLAGLAGVAALASGCGQGSPGSPGQVDIGAALPHLGDLPDGYRVGDDGGCGQITLENADEGLVRLLELGAPTPPRICKREISRAWSQRDDSEPPLVLAETVEWKDPQVAAQAFASLPDVARWTNGTSLTPIGRPAGMGDESETYTSTTALVGGQPDGAATAIAWREDAVTGLVIVAGIDGGRAEPLARRLAGVMLTRLRDPSEPTDAKLDDRTVALDDPALDVAVWWLGERWTSPVDGSVFELASSSALAPPGSGPGSRAEIQYVPEGSVGGGGITVAMWRTADWTAFAGTRLGTLAFDPPCGQTRTVSHSEGSARLITIAGGGDTDPAAGCGSASGASRSWAVATLGQDVVTVDLPPCLACVAPVPSSGPIDTPDGVIAVLQSLERRPGP